MRKFLLLSLGLATSGAAQTIVPLQPGELLENGGDQQMKVLACRPVPNVRFRECQTVLWKNGAPDSNPAWWNEEDLVRGDARVRAALGKHPRAGAAAAAKPAVGAPAAGPDYAGQCPRTPYGGPVPGTTKASTTLFQRKIADSYTMGVRDPAWTGVTFERVSVGAPVRNAVSMVAGRATRVNEAAPPNASLHPVTSTYVVCEQSGGQATRRRIVNSHYCFVSRDNEWVCGGGGGPPPRITFLR